MFRVLIYPSSGACDCAVELPHRSVVLGSLCVGDLVRLDLSGVRVVGCFSLQHGRMDILMSETCWVHKKWNKIASDIKLVYYSSTIAIMHSSINIRWGQLVSYIHCYENVCRCKRNIACFLLLWIVQSVEVKSYCVEVFYFSQCWGHILFMKASVFRNVTAVYFGGSFQQISKECKRLPENTTSHPSIM